MRRLAPVFLALVLALGSGRAALADVITLSDGTRLEGKVVDETTDAVVFEHALGAVKTRSTFQKTDVRTLEKSFAPAPPPEPSPAPPAVAVPVPLPPTSYPELATMTGRVMVCLDRSGSMTIADRFAAAEDEVERLVASMPPKLAFDVYLFDAGARSLFDGETLLPTKDCRAKLRGRLDAIGVTFQGFTDLLSALEPALARRPAAVYLFTDGVPTRGETRPAALVDAVAALARKHRTPIHVVGVLGGGYAFDPAIESQDGARAILSSIAAATGGRYREIAAGAREVSALRPDPRPTPGEVEVSLLCDGRVVPERALGFPRFDVDVVDAALVNGPVVLEYSQDVGVEVRSLNRAGVELDALRPLAMRYKDGRLASERTVRVVGGLDARGRVDAATGALLLRGEEGGIVEVVYRRAGQAFKRTVTIPKLEDGDGGVVVVPAGQPRPAAGTPAAGPGLPPRPTGVQPPRPVAPAGVGVGAGSGGGSNGSKPKTGS
jgi:hypothetical protein